ncbi:hypothetical protein O6H91_Y144700 [Diphasiastrum complanatum]|nr:hypothetical protein O6H91_Y144700 [Diphasiastrum complanatum]
MHKCFAAESLCFVLKELGSSHNRRPPPPSLILITATLSVSSSPCCCSSTTCSTVTSTFIHLCGNLELRQADHLHLHVHLYLHLHDHCPVYLQHGHRDDPYLAVIQLYHHLQAVQCHEPSPKCRVVVLGMDRLATKTPRCRVVVLGMGRLATN